MPSKLAITKESLEATDHGRELLSGDVTCTVQGSTGTIPVRMSCKVKEGQKYNPCGFDRASHVFVTIPGTNGGPSQKVGTFYPQGLHEGTFWPVRSIDEKRLAATNYVFGSLTGANDGKYIVDLDGCLSVPYVDATAVELDPLETKSEATARQANKGLNTDEKREVFEHTDSLTEALKAGLASSMEDEPNGVEEVQPSEVPTANVVATLHRGDKASEVLASIEGNET